MEISLEAGDKVTTCDFGKCRIKIKVYSYNIQLQIHVYHFLRKKIYNRFYI